MGNALTIAVRSERAQVCTQPRTRKLLWMTGVDRRIPLEASLDVSRLLNRGLAYLRDRLTGELGGDTVTARELSADSSPA